MSNSKGKKTVVEHVIELLNKYKYNLCAVDNGHAWQKLAYFDLNTGAIVKRKVVSIVGGEINSLTDINNKLVDTYSVGGERFVCNRDIQTPLELRVGSYQTSKENKALVAHTLYTSGLLNKKLILGTTLPLSRYYQDGKPNSVVIEACRKLFCETPTDRVINAEGEASDTMKVAAHLCLPESFLAYYDWAFQDDGEVRKECLEQIGPICVIDIGGGTTDISTILGGSGLSIDFHRSRTFDLGVIDCFNKINAIFVHAMSEAHPDLNVGQHGRVEQRIIEKLFEHGSVQVTGVAGTIDLHEQINKVKTEFVASIVEKARSVMGDITRYEKVLFVGGGAVVCKEMLEAALANSHFLDEFANATGLLKVMAFIENKQLITKANSNG